MNKQFSGHVRIPKEFTLKSLRNSIYNLLTEKKIKNE
jgi:hypothetical protein